MYFFMNTHRCLFNWVTHNSVIRFCEFLRGVIASYTAKDKFSINTLFLNYTIQLTRTCSSITRVSLFASACVRTQSITTHRIYVTAMRVGKTFVDVWNKKKRWMKLFYYKEKPTGLVFVERVWLYNSNAKLWNKYVTRKKKCLHIKYTIFTTLWNRYIFRNSSGVF